MFSVLNKGKWVNYPLPIEKINKNKNKKNIFFITKVGNLPK